MTGGAAGLPEAENTPNTKKLPPVSPLSAVLFLVETGINMTQKILESKEYKPREIRGITYDHRIPSDRFNKAVGTYVKKTTPFAAVDLGLAALGHVEMNEETESKLRELNEIHERIDNLRFSLNGNEEDVQAFQDEFKNRFDSLYGQYIKINIIKQNIEYAAVAENLVPGEVSALDVSSISIEFAANVGFDKTKQKLLATLSTFESGNTELPHGLFP